MTQVLIFDSGIGGLSVARHIHALLPAAVLTYVADDEFRPYGDKSEAQLNARLPGLLASLEIACQPDVIVIACNTASTTALPAIRAAVNAPVVGVVPAIKPAAQQSLTKSIAVLGTPGTVARAYVDDLISEFASDCAVTLVGSTALVEMAERKLAGGPVDMARLKREIAPIFTPPNGHNIDAVVLACTHFPLLVDELEKSAPHKVAWIDSGAAIARRTKLLLGRAQALEMTAGTSRHNTALLIGPQPSPARRKAFADFGFDRVVALKP
ncbi:MAG: glutamate racemase [Robiginitomaculum sp.]